MVLDSRTSADDKKTLAYDCLGYAKRAVAADDKNWAAHKWLAIGYKVVGDYEGRSEQFCVFVLCFTYEPKHAYKIVYYIIIIFFHDITANRKFKTPF